MQCFQSVRSLALRAGLVLATAWPAAAATTLTGNHNNNSGGNGYDTGAGDFIVPADAGSTPSAEFNSNYADGLSDNNPSTTSITINGGQFNGNGSVALAVGVGDGTLAINGGSFANNYDGADVGVSATITGGTFSGNSRLDLLIGAGNTSIYGGVFSSTSTNFVVGAGTGASLDLYGSFSGVAVGGSMTVTGASGSISGTLQDDTSSQTFSYLNNGGTITLHGVAAPEPASLSLIALAGVSFARRRKGGGSTAFVKC